ncbi:probable cytochrome P450 6a17 [Pieris napi]|uniref:probable cytochrome P450 6a17 n=1 Tax=Pieris napi TaxID=78633 RepID=UPI001FBB93A0|nr:probable cytochrome P450 6a17 [Pieris napi]
MFRLRKISTVSAILILVFQNCLIKSDILFYLLWCVVLIRLLMHLLTYDYDYWEKRGIFSPPALPFVGHIATVATMKEQGGMCFKRIYDEHKDKRFFGTHQFYQRTLVVCDPDIIKRMCVNDFYHFTDRGFFFNKNTDPLAESVLFLQGSEWKRLRAKISPIFSPNKLRGMFPILENTANAFVDRVRKLTQQDDIKHNENQNRNSNIKTKEKIDGNNNSTIGDLINLGEDIKEIELKKTQKSSPSSGDNAIMYAKKNCIKVDAEKLVGGYTADAIVPCAFGLKSNVMYNSKDPFAVALHAFYEMSWFNIFEKTMRQFWPAFVLFFKIRIIPKKTHDFFYNIVTKVLRDRSSGVQEKRGDFIDMMMALQSDEKCDDENDYKITDMIISANAFIIFLGGFETTSSTLAFLFLELAAHPEVQEKMRKEIREVVERNGGLTYEALQDLTYMEMVIQETLRLYPPFPTIQRMCTKDYTIPETSAVVEKGTVVIFPTLGIQRDEQYFENASQFIPERWSEGKSAPRPGVYMPFGDGPRYCIGKRFAIIQMKCCLARLLPQILIKPVGGHIRTQPFIADPLCPMTLHPADSRVIITSL